MSIEFLAYFAWVAGAAYFLRIALGGLLTATARHDDTVGINVAIAVFLVLLVFIGAWPPASIWLLGFLFGIVLSFSLPLSLLHAVAVILILVVVHFQRKRFFGK